MVTVMQLVLCEAAAAEVCGLHICMYLHSHCLHPSKVSSILYYNFITVSINLTRARLDNTSFSPTSVHLRLTKYTTVYSTQSRHSVPNQPRRKLGHHGISKGDTWLHRLTRPVPCRSSRQCSMSRAYCSTHTMSVSKLLQLRIALHDRSSLNDCSGDVPTNHVYDSSAELKNCRLLGRRLPATIQCLSSDPCGTMSASAHPNESGFCEALCVAQAGAKALHDHEWVGSPCNLQGPSAQHARRNSNLAVLKHLIHVLLCLHAPHKVSGYRKLETWTCEYEGSETHCAAESVPISLCCSAAKPQCAYRVACQGWCLML